MCEILFLTFLTIKIGDFAENKGYSPLLFRAVVVAVWMLAEGLGWYIAGTRISVEEMGIMRVWVTGFIAALVCGPMVFVVLALLPNRGPNQRTGAFGDYRDHLEAGERPRRRKSSRRRRADEDDPRRGSFDV